MKLEVVKWTRLRVLIVILQIKLDLYVIHKKVQKLRNDKNS